MNGRGEPRELGALELPFATEPIPLDPARLRQLAEWRPALGVLTIYVDADPSVQAHSMPPWRTLIERELDAIEGRLRDEGPRESWRALRRLREDAATTIDAFTSPAAAGRGRVLMLALAEGPPKGLALQAELVTAAVLDSGPRLLPLIAALDRGGLIGVVAAARDEIHVVETRLGRVGEVETRAFERGADDPRQHRGPAAPNPARAQHATRHLEKYERHVGEQRAAFLEDVAADVERRRSAAGWSGVLVAAGPGLAEELASAIGRRAPEVHAVHLDVATTPSHALIARLGPEIAAFAVDREARALASALAAAAASGRGVRGLEAALAALNEGRVSHLFLPRRGDVPGTMQPSGELSRALESDAVASAPLDSLFEAMAARALETSARVSVVEGEGTGEVVAATRW